MKIHRGATTGQTLIETLITILFLAVSVVVLVRYQGFLAWNNTLSRQKSYAVSLAFSKMEQLVFIQTLNTTAGYSAWQDIASGTSSYSGTNATYTLTWTVTTNASPSYKTIDIVVSWTDTQGNAQSVRQDTIIAGINPQLSGAII